MPSTTQNLPVLDIQKIMDLLPHRFPFLMVDRVLELEPSTRIVAIKNVSANEPWVPGHYPFPQPTVMPGSLKIEAAAQVTAMMFLAEDESAGKMPALAGVDGFRFRLPVTPVDQILITAELIRSKKGLFKVGVVGKVDDKIAFEGIVLGTNLDSGKTIDSTQE